MIMLAVSSAPWHHFDHIFVQGCLLNPRGRLLGNAASLAPGDRIRGTALWVIILLAISTGDLRRSASNRRCPRVYFTLGFLPI